VTEYPDQSNESVCLQILSPDFVSGFCLRILSPDFVSGFCLRILSPDFVSQDWLDSLTINDDTNNNLKNENHFFF
jgi:hypothetical protein